MVPAAGDADERRYARVVADRFGIDLLEIPVGLEDFDVMANPSRLTARPTGFGQMGAIDRKLREAQLDASISSVFSGAGGDSIFCALQSTAPIIDAWHDGGLRLARSTLSAVATVAETSEWDTARHLARRLARSSGRRWQWPADDDLLGPSARQARAPDALVLQALRPGSRAHVASILRIQTIIDAHARIGEGGMRFPLMAQPVLETCLAIPSWRWFVGGRDRAAAREAFAGRVPAPILQRRGKGRLDTLLIQAYDRNRPALRELLANGWLHSQGLIDMMAVDHVLANPIRPGSTRHSRLTDLADAELWCRMVRDRQREARPF
jgi:asparagine synthase (glutamine-hydrolysing)